MGVIFTFAVKSFEAVMNQFPSLDGCMSLICLVCPLAQFNSSPVWKQNTRMTEVKERSLKVKHLFNLLSDCFGTINFVILYQYSI